MQFRTLYLNVTVVSKVNIIYNTYQNNFHVAKIPDSSPFMSDSHFRIWTGGPPMRIDDTGTPGNKNGEINISFQGTQKNSQSSYALPDIDINYGLGEEKTSRLSCIVCEIIPVLSFLL